MYPLKVIVPVTEPRQNGETPPVKLPPTDVLTVIPIAFEVAGLPVTQVAFEVSTQVIISAFVGKYTNVLLFVPTFDPFTFH